MRRVAAACVLLLWGAGASAQVVDNCDWRVSAHNLVEPWENNTRLFANGNVRLALMDTVEPAAGAYHLMLVSPPYNELGERQCKVVSLVETIGFADLNFQSLTADYSPAVGLIFRFPVGLYDPGSVVLQPAILKVTLNQSNGLVKATVE